MNTAIFRAGRGATAVAQVVATPSTRVRGVRLVLSNFAQRYAVGDTYCLTNAQGEKTALVTITQQGLGSTRRAAMRMALSGDLVGALRAASADYELSGAVSTDTMHRMRLLLGEVDA